MRCESDFELLRADWRQLQDRPTDSRGCSWSEQRRCHGCIGLCMIVWFIFEAKRDACCMHALPCWQVLRRRCACSCERGLLSGVVLRGRRDVCCMHTLPCWQVLRRRRACSCERGLLSGVVLRGRRYVCCMHALPLWIIGHQHRAFCLQTMFVWFFFTSRQQRLSNS